MWRTIGTLDVSSRYFLAPINTGLAIDGYPTAPLLSFHIERACPSIGVAYVGNVAVDPAAMTNSGTLLISRASSWSQLASAIASRGSLPAVQLAYRLPGLAPQRSWINARRTEYIEWARSRISSLSPAEFGAIAAQIVSGARAASDHGFVVVQLHAAHGYLLSQLLSRHINLRRDAFAYPCMEFFSRLAQSIRSALPSIVLDVRVSVLEGFEGADAEWAERRPLMLLLSEVGFDIVSLSGGHYDIDKSLIYPKGAVGPPPYLRYAAALAKANVSCVWNVAGNIRDLSAIQPILDKHPNLCLSLGRPLIADSKFVAKFLGLHPGMVRNCSECGDCHYFSRGHPHIVCPESLDLLT